MIEVERRFFVNDEDRARLVDGAKFLHKKTFTDTYYDTQNHDWTRKDHWIRERDNGWVLKAATEDTAKYTTDLYKEHHEQEDILKALGLNPLDSISDALLDNGITPFAIFTTTRESFHKDGHTIVFDETDFGFKTCEIEIEVPDESHMHTAREKIEAFAQSHDLTMDRCSGKMVAYLRNHRPAHLDVLFEHGVIRE